MITQAMISSDVDSQYSKPEEKAAANAAYNIGLDWVNSQPKTWCMSDERKSRLEQRREARQKRKQQAQQMYDHIWNKMVPPEAATQTAEGYQVVGLGFIAMVVLGAIISWVVQRLLTHYWDGT